jgi:hypothetical protein
MTRENVEVFRRGWKHFRATGDLLSEIVDPDFVWDMSTFRGWPEQQTYQGRRKGLPRGLGRSLGGLGAGD